MVNPPELPSLSVLSHQHLGLQSSQSVAEHLALLSQGNLLLHRRAAPKLLTAQILSIDCEIDQVIYDLYGLTAEEIYLIERGVR